MGPRRVAMTAGSTCAAESHARLIQMRRLTRDQKRLTRDQKSETPPYEGGVLTLPESTGLTGPILVPTQSENHVPLLAPPEADRLATASADEGQFSEFFMAIPAGALWMGALQELCVAVRHRRTK